MLAAINGHTAAVKLLLDMASVINVQIETNRNMAQTLACFQGQHEVVSLLLDQKAIVEYRAKTGLTPLMEAAIGGYARDTALTIAADKGHYRFVELLLSRNKKGNFSLWLTATWTWCSCCTAPGPTSTPRTTARCRICKICFTKAFS